MPRRPVEKQCEWCQRTWCPWKPSARTCSARCRAALVMSEKGIARPKPPPMPGFAFLDGSDFVTTAEAASVLGVVPATVRYWISTGALAATGQGAGTGSLIKVRVGDVRRILADGEHRPIGGGGK